MTKKFKSQPSAGEIILHLFGGIEGAILVYFTPKGETVNSQNVVICYERNWSLGSDPNAVENVRAKFLKDATKKNFFLTELKKL
jgi:hypothetical protein